ncbi:hypothetical protein Hanom_Chr17g01587761 [Helianthus anomalus]
MAGRFVFKNDPTMPPGPFTFPNPGLTGQSGPVVKTLHNTTSYAINIGDISVP